MENNIINFNIDALIFELKKPFYKRSINRKEISEQVGQCYKLASDLPDGELKNKFYRVIGSHNEYYDTGIIENIKIRITGYDDDKEIYLFDERNTKVFQGIYLRYKNEKCVGMQINWSLENITSIDRDGNTFTQRINKLFAAKQEYPTGFLVRDEKVIIQSNNLIKKLFDIFNIVYQIHWKNYIQTETFIPSFTNNFSKDKFLKSIFNLNQQEFEIRFNLRQSGDRNIKIENGVLLELYKKYLDNNDDNYEYSSCLGKLPHSFEMCDGRLQITI